MESRMGQNKHTNKHQFQAQSYTCAKTQMRKSSQKIKIPDVLPSVEVIAGETGNEKK